MQVPQRGKVEQNASGTQYTQSWCQKAAECLESVTPHKAKNLQFLSSAVCTLRSAKQHGSPHNLLEFPQRTAGQPTWPQSHLIILGIYLLCR